MLLFSEQRGLSKDTECYGDQEKGDRNKLCGEDGGICGKKTNFLPGKGLLQD